MEQQEVASIELKQETSATKQLSEEELKEKTKKLSIKEVTATSVMDGAGSRYITPYALAIGANNTQISLLTSLPSLLGNLLQLWTPKAIEKYSRKKIIALGVFLQALMWLPMLGVGYFFFYRGVDHGISASLMIIFYTLFVIFGAFLSPAWNSLMKDIVTKDRGQYFGKRNRRAGIISILVFLICGFVLHYFQGISNLFIGFLILFSVAFISRLTSGYLITKHYEPELKLEKGYYFSFWQFIKKIPQSNFGKFSVFISLVMFATAIASPFFSVYMLRDLKFSYLAWALVCVSGSISAFLFMPVWGKIADKFGNLKVMRVTGAFIPLIPLLWLPTVLLIKISLITVIIYILVEEFVSNLIWAGFNLCYANFIYDAVTRQKVALCIAYFNVLNGIGVFIGASLGALVASSNFSLFGFSSLLSVFLISGIVRFIVYVIMIPKIKEVREVQRYEKGEIRREIEKVFIPFRFLRNNHHQSNNPAPINPTFVTSSTRESTSSNP
jgi:MFS family permease